MEPDEEILPIYMVDLITYVMEPDLITDVMEP